MNTYRGYSYDMDADETWFWVDSDGVKTSGLPNDDACMDAIDAHKRAHRIATPAA